MSDPNNRRILPMKDEIPASPSADETVDTTTTCASTIGTASQQHPGHSIASSFMRGGANTTSRPSSSDVTRRHVLHLGLASSGAAAALVVSVVPLNILIGITTVFLLWLSFLYQVFQLMRSEYNRALEGRGLGDMLPASWYESLVHTSFHEFMTDGAFARENQHFLLYFIPGLSRDQLEDYLERLVPRHRRRLHRPGLGNFLGDGFMRHVIGDQGMAELPAPRRSGGIQAVPQRLTLPVTTGQEHPTPHSDDTASGLGEEPTTTGSSSTNARRLIPRRLDLEVINEDVASRLGDDDDEEEDAAAWGVASTLTVPRGSRTAIVLDAASSSSEESEDLSMEEEIVVEAAVTGAVSFFTFALGYSQHAMANSVVNTGRSLFRASLGLGLVSIGAGALGIWSGYLSPQDIQLPTQWTRETRNMVMSSTIASGATAGLFMLLGYSRSPSPPSHTKSPSSGDKSKLRKKR